VARREWDDYRRPVTGDMPVSIVIPAGASSYTLNIAAMGNETGANPETASLTIASDPTYIVGAPASATVTLVSNVVITLPTVTVTATDANASRVGLDPGTFTVTRNGSTSGALTVNYSLTGTATNGTDYNALGTALTMPAGAASPLSRSFRNQPASYVSAETVALALSANPAYTVGSANNATVTMAGNSVPSTLGKSSPNMKVTWHSVVGKIYRVASKNSLATRRGWT